MCAFPPHARGTPQLLRRHSSHHHSPHLQLKVWKAGESPPPFSYCITCLPTKCSYERLEYLVATRRDAGIGWREALIMEDSEWSDMYTGFVGWRRRRGQ
jgi:hypothetical protein